MAWTSPGVKKMALSLVVASATSCLTFRPLSAWSLASKHVEEPIAMRVTPLSMGNMFGLKKSSSRVACMGTTFKITLKTPDMETGFEAPDNMYILDAAENAGSDLSYSSRAGVCSACAGKIEKGTVDQNGGPFLDDDQIDQGFC